MQRLALAVLFALAPGCSCLQTVAECPPDCADSGSPPDGGDQDDDAGVADAGLTRQWIDVTPTGPSPTGRDSLAAAYDSLHDKVLVFGGQTDDPSVSFDTWEWDPANRTWTQLALTGPLYLYPQMIYDAQRDRFVLAAQDSGDGRVDLSTWDHGTNSWVHLDAMGGPPPYRQFTALVYTTDGNALVFAGAAGDTSDFELTNTWLFDGQQWLPRAPAHVPPARVFTQLTADSATGRVWLYAGNVPDLWSWDGSDWTKLDDGSSGAPEPEGPAIVYDAQAKRVVAWGECLATQSRVWEWDGTKWASFELTPSPPERCYGTLVYDSKRGEVFAFGGQIFDVSCSCAKRYTDTWIYRLR